MLRLPEPMLARAGAVPTGEGWLFEPKLDGFRCLTCTHGRFRARSRRGWDMSKLLAEIARALPADVQFDGEIVAFDADGKPNFDRLSRRMLHGDASIAVTYVVFDVLACEGLATTMLPYAERRMLLDELDVEASESVRVVSTFEDGETLFQVICDRGLEGVVAKQLRDPYRSNERGWVKTKNRATARFARELAGATRMR